MFSFGKFQSRSARPARSGKSSSSGRPFSHACRLEVLESRSLLSIGAGLPTDQLFSADPSTLSAPIPAAYSTVTVTEPTIAEPLAEATSTSLTQPATTATVTEPITAEPLATTNTVRLSAAWFAARGTGPYLLNASNTTYILDTDVTVPGTAFIRTNVTATIRTSVSAAASVRLNIYRSISFTSRPSDTIHYIVTGPRSHYCTVNYSCNCIYFKG